MHGCKATASIMDTEFRPNGNMKHMYVYVLRGMMYSQVYVYVYALMLAANARMTSPNLREILVLCERLSRVETGFRGTGHRYGEENVSASHRCVQVSAGGVVGVCAVCDVHVEYG